MALLVTSSTLEDRNHISKLILVGSSGVVFLFDDGSHLHFFSNLKITSCIIFAEK